MIPTDGEFGIFLGDAQPTAQRLVPVAFLLEALRGCNGRLEHLLPGGRRRRRGGSQRRADGSADGSRGGGGGRGWLGGRELRQICGRGDRGRVVGAGNAGIWLGA